MCCVRAVCEDISNACWIEIRIKKDIAVYYNRKYTETVNVGIVSEAHSHAQHTAAHTSTVVWSRALHRIPTIRCEAAKKWKIVYTSSDDWYRAVYVHKSGVSYRIHTRHLHIAKWLNGCAESLSRVLSHSFSHLSSGCMCIVVITMAFPFYTQYSKKDPSKCDKYANAEKKKSCIGLCLCIRISPFFGYHANQLGGGVNFQ